MGHRFLARGRQAAKRLAQSNRSADDRNARMGRAVRQWVESLETRQLLASVLTDLGDYAFGQTAQITGSGFHSGETVQLQVTHADGTDGSNEHAQNQAWSVTDGGAGDLDGLVDGNIQTTWLVDDPDAIGATYVLSAQGLGSGELATTMFTDASIVINSNMNWSAITTGSGPGGQPNASDSITINGPFTLTVDVSNALVGSINVNPNVNSQTGTLAFNAGGVVTVTGNVIVGGSSNNRRGVIDMTAGGLLKVGNALTFSTSTLGLLTAGTGTIEFNRAGNQTIPLRTYNNVTLSGSGTKQIATGGSFTANGVVTLANNVTFDLFDVGSNGGTATIGGLTTSGSGAGAVVTNNNVATLIINAAGSFTYAGAITNNGDLNIVKNGAGTQAFAGANTYKGTTTVSAGTLLVNGTHIPSDSALGAYTISSGATLGGTGDIRGTVTNNGTINPGVTVGTLQVRNKNVSFGASSFFHADLAMNGLTPVADQLHVNNTSGSTNRSISVNASAALDLAISSDFTAAVNQSFTIINNATGGSTGTFNATGKVNGVTTTLSDNATFTTVAGQQFRVDYVGNDLVLIYLGQANAAPVAQNGSNTTDEDNAVNGTAAATDDDGDALTYSLVGANGGAVNGTVVLNANDGTYTYTPNANFNGSDSFSFKANDGTADSNVATVSITVNSVNDAPVAAGDGYNVNEDQALNGASVLGNDSDAHGGAPNENNTPLTAVLVGDVEHGTLVLNTDGTFTYTPDEHYFGSDSFTYRAKDSLNGQSSVTTVTISVAEVNDAPTADDDSKTTNEDTTATGNVLGNDADVDNDTLTVVEVNGSAGGVGMAVPTSHGSVTVDADGSYSYTPDENFFGSDSFTYKVSDGRGGSDTATVNITVNEVNDAPEATADSATTGEDTAVSGNVLANDSDPDNEDGITGNEDDLDAELVSGPANGSLVLNAETGAFTYTPDENFFGSDSFTYRAVDGDGAESSVVTVSITVNEVNDAPVAVADEYTTDEDTAVSGNVLDNDTDPDNEDGISGNEDTLTAVLVSGPANGTLVFNADGSFTYTPDANFFGDDSFTYKANDGSEDSITVTVSVEVTEVNDPPVATADSATTNEDAAVSGNVLANDSDPDNEDGITGNEDDLDAELVSGPANGSLVLNAETGAFTYTPDADFFGSDSFTYRAVDGDGAESSVVTVSITVTEVNDDPVAADDSASTTQDTPVSGNVLTNDTDPDNEDGITGNEDTLAATLLTGPSHGTLTLNADGSFTYTPALGYSGADSFTYTVSDGRGGSDTGEVSLFVAAEQPNSIYLRNDPCMPGQQMLIVNGSGGADNIHVAPATGGGVEVFLNGASQGTYVFGGRIVVFGYGGDDLVQIAGAVPNVAWLYGDGGHDTLNLGNGGGIAWGGDGNDHLSGGSARDIFVGGEGGDRIVGNAGDDILCAGLTDYDDRFSAASDHEEAWCHIYKEWSRTDLVTVSIAGDSSYTAFEQRIDHLKGPSSGGTVGGQNTGFYLNNSTVDDDDAQDQIDMLTGSAGEDWFLWTKGEDKVNGLSSTEAMEDLDSIS